TAGWGWPAYCTRRATTSSTSPTALAVHGEAVAEEDGVEHHEPDDQAREHAVPPRAEHERPGVGDHQSPLRARVLRRQAEERQTGDGEQHVAEVEGDTRCQRSTKVRDHVPAQEVRCAGAERARRLD